jgi:hypothetical protein
METAVASYSTGRRKWINANFALVLMLRFCKGGVPVGIGGPAERFFV